MNYAQPNFDLLRELSPQERIHFLRDHIDACINLTESGTERNGMADANLALMKAQDELDRSKLRPNKHL